MIFIIEAQDVNCTTSNKYGLLGINFNRAIRFKEGDKLQIDLEEVVNKRLLCPAELAIKEKGEEKLPKFKDIIGLFNKD